MSLGKLALGSALLGFLSHVVWFIRGEQDYYSRYYVAIWTAAQLVGYYAFTRIMDQSASGAVLSTTVLSASFLCTLFSSIIVYRLFFHRLRHFDGPVSWKATKLTQMFKNLDYKGYRHLDALHRQYGKYVRTGPREISTIDPVACAQILGPGSVCSKAVWYDMGQPLLSVHQTRDKKLHEIRRRHWDKGLNVKSLRNYETRIVKYTEKLMQQLRSLGKNPEGLNASKWLNYFSFDVMGDMAFGESFHMLDTGDTHFAIPLLQQGLDGLNIGPAVPWFFYFMAIVPIITRPYYEFIAWSNEQAEKRKTMKVTEPDVMHYLLEAPPMSTNEQVNQSWQAGDARLIIVAGSDTTAATLTYCVRELIKHPEVVEKLRRAVAPHIWDSQVDHISIQKCAYLNAVIDEALRLHPPVPSGMVRVTPPEGINVGNRYIPGDVNIVLPLWSIQRSADAYDLPEDFIPERWTDRPELIKMKGAWAPFSMGPYGCPGKGLAYMELRSVIARLVTEFDLAFAGSEDGSTLVKESKDHFTLSLADLWITCKPRTTT